MKYTTNGMKRKSPTNRPIKIILKNLLISMKYENLGTNLSTFFFFNAFRNCTCKALSRLVQI